MDERSINRKEYGTLKFQQLVLTPDQTYFDVESIKTKDDVKMRIKTVIQPKDY